jgi:hypothetical protein
MCDPRYLDASHIVIDAVEDPIVAAPERPDARELANERLPRTRIAAKPVQRCEDGALLCALQSPQVLGRAVGDHDLVGRTHSGVGFPLELLEILGPPLRQIGKAFAQGSQLLRVTEDGQRLFERLEVVGTDQHGSGPPIPSDGDAVALSGDPIDQLR